MLYVVTLLIIVQYLHTACIYLAYLYTACILLAYTCIIFNISNPYLVLDMRFAPFLVHLLLLYPMYIIIKFLYSYILFLPRQYVALSKAKVNSVATTCTYVHVYHIRTCTSFWT